MEERIDINRADVETLTSLPGIGPSLAAKIVEYRTAVHPFEEIIELAAVPGISERMVREITDQIVVNETAEAESISLPDTGPPVEEIEVEAPESVDGSEAPGGPEEEQVEEETAEPDVSPIDEASDISEVEEDDSPVVVTMLDENRVRPETTLPPETAALPEPPPQPPPPEIIERRVVETVQRRHFHLGQQFLGIVAGAVLGVFFTLLFLFLLNGTLHFTPDRQTADLQVQVDEETSAIRQSQSSMTDELGALTGRVAELENDLAASGEAIDSVEGDVSDLEAETAALNERLEAIDLSAEKFDAFLSGMRDLLVTLQGLPPSPTSTTPISGTATITATMTPEGTAVSPTATPTPASQTPAAGSPTRTPRPTATPIVE